MLPQAESLFRSGSVKIGKAEEIVADADVAEHLPVARFKYVERQGHAGNSTTASGKSGSSFTPRTMSLASLINHGLLTVNLGTKRARVVGLDFYLREVFIIAEGKREVSKSV